MMDVDDLRELDDNRYIDEDEEEEQDEYSYEDYCYDFCEYETQYSMLVRSQKQTHIVNRAAKFNYICSLICLLVSLAFMVIANWYIRGL